MRYTVKKLFEIISEEKDENEFFYESGFDNENAEYFIKLITNFSPTEKVLIKSDCHDKYLNDFNLVEQEISVDGVIIFHRMAHEEDYTVCIINSIDEAKEIILGFGGITSMFTADIVILENGVRKKYCIKDKKGEVIKSTDFEKKDFNNLDDEYFLQWI